MVLNAVMLIWPRAWMGVLEAGMEGKEGVSVSFTLFSGVSNIL